MNNDDRTGKIYERHKTVLEKSLIALAKGVLSYLGE